MADPIRVVVAGAAGRMGREGVRAVSEAEGLELVAAIDREEVGQDAGEIAGIGPIAVRITPELAAAIAESAPHVLVDFTVAESATPNIEAALAAGVSPVVGTTG